ncbi:MAG: ABC transporter substrate-binding protein [Deltaproteobacteria bacterium]|nr:ABC transporter substrate-binding protein [Deltaproteobacteria bacterium]
MIRLAGVMAIVCMWCTAGMWTICGPAFAQDRQRRQLNVSVFDQAFGTSSESTPDPLKSRQMQYFHLQHQVFETLVTIDFTTNTVLPMLAETWERLDERTVRFFLRHGVRFHSGEIFNAAAVTFTLELMKNPRSRFAGRFLLDTIESVTAVDDYTVDITTRVPDGMLLRKLAAIGFIIPPVYYTRVGESYFSRYPMGTGPFRFFYIDDTAEYLKIHFVRNEQYWRSLDCNFDELVFHALETGRQWEALRNGTLDLLVSLPQGGDPGKPRLKKIKVGSELSLRSAALLFNVDKGGPLAQIEVRQAVQHAIDRTEMIRRALGGFGLPLYSVAPRGTLGHCPGPLQYREDIKKARALMAQAGFGEGIALRMLTSAHEPSVTAAAVLKEQLARAGITLEVTALSREEIFRQMIEPRLRGEPVPDSYDLWLVSGWPHLFGSGTHFYFAFLHSGGIFNFGTLRKQDSPIDALYSAAVAAGETEQVCAELQKLDRYLLEEALVVPLYQMEMFYGMRSNIQFIPGMNDMPLRFERIRIVD